MSSGNTAGDLFNAGAMQQWIYVFNQAGGGSRGVAAGERYLTSNFPDANSATRRVIADVARDSLAAARRYNTANDTYQLPASAYADVSGYQRRAGTEGVTMYENRITYSFDVTRPGGQVHTRTQTVSVRSNQRLTLAQIRARGDDLARAQILAHLKDSPTSRKGPPGLPYDLTVTSAFRYVG